VLLPPEAAAFSQPSSSTSRLAKNCGTSGANYHGLGVAEHCGYPVASWTFDIHKVAVRVLNQTLQLVLPLLLMRLRVQQILSKRHLLSESK